MTKIKQMVCVEWEDSSIYDDRKSAAHNFTLIPIETYGLLVKENKVSISLSHEFFPDDKTVKTTSVISKKLCSKITRFNLDKTK